MVSKARGIGAGILITLGSSIMIGGVALAIHCGIPILDLDGNKEATFFLPEAIAAIFGSIAVAFVGAVIVALSGLLLEDNEKGKEDKKAIIKAEAENVKKSKKAIRYDEKNQRVAQCF